ncbi:MAG: hypothetical protein CL557_17550 [Alphaproteobacteria bacterium]|nr:hypothetical protein [Alphaproteobacteria bacterium]
MDTMSIKLDADVYNSMEAKKPRYLSTSGFIALVLEIHDKGEVAGLTLPPLQSPHHQPTLNEERIEREKEGLNESEANVHKGRKGERKETKTKRYQFVVPDELDFCKGDLTTYWKEGKTGKKTEHAAKLLFLEVAKIAAFYSESIALEQIALATANGWESITLKNYERFGLAPNVSKQTKEPESKHPAYKVFKASDVYGDKGPTTNPVMQSLLNG